MSSWYTIDTKVIMIRNFRKCDVEQTTPRPRIVNQWAIDPLTLYTVLTTSHDKYIVGEGGERLSLDAFLQDVANAQVNIYDKDNIPS